MGRVRRILMDLFYQVINQHRREAHARGIRLLKENLSSAQRAQYEKRGYFDVIGGDTGRRYRIRSGAQMNAVDRGTRSGSSRRFPPLPAGNAVDPARRRKLPRHPRK
jgi:hypothetical protein